MIRRDFLSTAVLALIGVFVPALGCSSEKTEMIRVLSTPETLFKIMDEEKIKNLGIEYLNKYPNEAFNEKLSKLIFQNYPNHISSLKLESLIKENIKSEFVTDDVVVLKGWVLSKTEARQCALFSLNF